MTGNRVLAQDATQRRRHPAAVFRWPWGEMSGDMMAVALKGEPPLAVPMILNQAKTKGGRIATTCR